MIRELVLVSADFSAMPWFGGREPPAPKPPDGIALATLSASPPPRLFAQGPVPTDEAGRRLAEGDTCHVATTASGDMVGQMWCSERTRFIDWIGCNIRPPLGHVHIYNSFIEPEFRGIGLQWLLASAACRDVAARGRTHMCAGVERKEYPGFARKYAAMGLALIVPYKAVWSLRVRGVTLAVVPARPPRVLETARRNAAKVLSHPAEHA